jgi:hypothetical protein
MALLPAIPDRPLDRPETWFEYRERREILAMHRALFDELTSWLNRMPPFEPFDWLYRGVPFSAPPIKRQLRVAWNCWRAPWHEHPTYEDALRCAESAPPPHLGRFEGYYLSDAERRRIEGTI